MCSCPGSNSGPSCRQTFQTSTAPLKRDEILEKSEVISDSKSYTTTGAIFFSCFGLKPSSEPCMRGHFHCKIDKYFLYCFSLDLVYV